MYWDNAFGTIIVARYSLANGDNKLDVDYRMGVVSFIKEAVSNHNRTLFSLLFESKNPIVKPYTFSVTFGDSVRMQDGKIVFESPVVFKFGSNCPEIIAMVYNHIIANKDGPLHKKFKLEHIDILTPKKISKDNALFRTLSPVVVRSHINKDHSYCPKSVNFEGDEKFDEAFRSNLGGQVKHLLKTDELGDIEFHPVKTRKLVVKHMGLSIPGFVGVFSLKARPEILNMVNQVGLGSRRSQGFGMLELVKEI